MVFWYCCSLNHFAHMKHLLLLGFLLIGSAASAQYETPITFYLEDGSEVNGFFSFFYYESKYIYYSDAPNGEPQKMEVKKIKHMVTSVGESQFRYDRVDVMHDKKDKVVATMMMQALIDGYMTLYYYNGDIASYYLKPSPNAKGVYYATFTYKPNTTKRYPKQEKFVNKNFTKNAAAFFQDHPEISKEFAEGKADFMKMGEMVTRYNEFKGAQ